MCDDIQLVSATLYLYSVFTTIIKSLHKVGVNAGFSVSEVTGIVYTQHLKGTLIEFQKLFDYPALMDFTGTFTASQSHKHGFRL